MFKKNYTQWKSLGFHSFSGHDYVTMARRNKKTGMLYFKTKRMQTVGLSNRIELPKIDVGLQWIEITLGQ